MKIRIAIDVDGVIFDIITPWIKNYNKMFNDNLNPETFDSGNIHKFIKPECSEDILYGEKLLTNKIISAAKFYRGAKEKIIDLSENNKIIFLTSTFQHNRVARTKRLIKEFGNIDFDLVFSKSKEFHYANIFIDDSYHFCNMYKSRNKNSIVTLVNRPWNKLKQWPDKYRIDELRYFDLNKFVQP